MAAKMSNLFEESDDSNLDGQLYNLNDSNNNKDRNISMDSNNSESEEDTRNISSCSSEMNSISAVVLPSNKLDSPISENGSNDEDEAASLARDLVLRKLVQYAGQDKEQVMRRKMKELDLNTLSDFNFINVHEAFKDVMKAVPLGKLHSDLEKMKQDANMQEDETTILIFDELWSKSFLNKLKGNVILNRTDRTKVIQDVAHELNLKASSVSLKLCQKISNTLYIKYQKALFGLRKTEKTADKIYSHWKYLKRIEKQGTKITEKPPGEKIVLYRFNNRHNFGIDPERDLPTSFSPGETSQTQLEKQQKLLGMFNSGEINWKEVDKLMKETYASQRIPINEKKNMEELLKRWPFFGKFFVLKAHFERLMNVDLQAIMKRMEDFLPIFFKFLEAEANKNVKGAAGQKIVSDLRNVISKYRTVEQNDTGNLNFVAIVLGILLKTKASTKWLFLHFEETTSIDEIQASSKLPDDGKPRVAVLGGDLFSNPKCYVVVEKRCISTTSLKPSQAIMAAFMMYWVLKLLYPPRCAGLFHFLEREIFEIKPSGGVGRVEREKTDKGWKSAPGLLSRSYLTLMEEFAAYNDKWSQ